MSRLVLGGGDIGKAIGGTILNKSDCDIRNFEDVIRAVDKFKPTTIVVTAGVSHPSDIRSSDPNDFEEEIEVNLVGGFNAAKAAAMLKVQNIVFIASIAGLYGKPNHAGYSASKAGVISLVESLAMEGHGAYAISPGRVNTSMRQKDYPNDMPGTRLEPEEIAQIVGDIEAGKYTSGDNIIIRRIGTETQPIKVDRNERWQKELRVGEPVTL